METLSLFLLVTSGAADLPAGRLRALRHNSAPPAGEPQVNKFNLPPAATTQGLVSSKAELYKASFSSSMELVMQPRREQPSTL